MPCIWRQLLARIIRRDSRLSIYGRDVQDIGDTEITADVEEKLLQFAKAGLAVATMKGTSYLSMGTVSMGIAGCIVDEGFSRSILGCAMNMWI